MAIKKTNILLESGTNELEVLEFTISNQHFGINVSKVKEIVKYRETTPMPNSSPFVEGIFKPREEIGILTLVNLAGYMGLPDSDDPEKDIFIITNFNNFFSAFHVHTVEHIHRIKWDDIEKPDATIYGGQDGLATGVARIGERLITIVDFEKILFEIGLKRGLGTEEPPAENRPVYVRPIMVVEDSSLLERLLAEYLTKSGFTNIIECSNGKEAWDIVHGYRSSGLPIKEHVSLIITDIEMPKMDGHRLTKLIKEDEVLREIPVIIFSSLMNDDMRSKGRAVGANAQLSKAELNQLLPTIDALLYGG